MTHTATGSRAALARRIAVTIAFPVSILGAMIGNGLFGGTPQAEAAGGLFATDATLLAPASPAFSVWSLIYAALGAYTVWQWWDRSDPRRLGWLVAASMLLNAAWLLVVQADQVWLSVVVMLALLAVLAEAFRRLLSARPRSWIETVVADGTLGLYLGWVCVATCANIASALTGAGFTGGAYPEAWAVGVLAVVAIIGVALAVVGRGRIAVAATIVWGLAWLAVERTTGDLESTATALAAVLAALLVAAATVVFRVRAQRRPAGGQGLR